MSISNELRKKLQEAIVEELNRCLDNDNDVPQDVPQTEHVGLEDWAEVILNRVLDPIIDEVTRRSVFDHNEPGGKMEVSARVTQLDKNRIQIASVAQGPPARRREMQLKLSQVIDKALKDFTEKYLHGLN